MVKVEIIEHLEAIQHNQDSINDIYGKVCGVIFEELDEKFDLKSARKSTKKKYKVNKPYWSDELDKSWKAMHDAEKTFLKCKDHQQQKTLRQEYKFKQQYFDKLLRKTSRSYNRQVISELDQACDDNPKRFWDMLNRLGPRAKKNIPIMVRIGDELVADEKDVCNKWKSDFENLFNQGNNICSVI